MNKKICLIGCGPHARKAYAPSLIKYTTEVGGIDYAACCSRNIDKAKSFQQLSNSKKIYTEYKEMLEKERPDAVLLVAPYKYISKIAIDSINAGCAVMIEKPPGKNLAEYKNIVRAIQRKKVINMIAFNRRYMPLIKELMKWIYHDEVPFRLQHIDYKMYRVKRCEPDFYATAIHGIDLVSYIAQASYSNININYRKMEHFGSGVVNIEMQGNLTSGTTAHLSFNPVTGILIERIVACGDNSTIFVDLPVWNNLDSPGIIRQFKDGVFLREKLGSDLTGEGLIDTNGFYNQLYEFLSCVCKSKITSNNIHSAMDTMKMFEHIRKYKVTYKVPKFINGFFKKG